MVHTMERTDKSSEYRRLGSLDYIFPMYTVPLEIFLHMKRIRTYEEMLADNELTQFEEHMGKAMFISHQWLGSKHPDPCGQQIKVLQAALSNILSGTSQVSLPIVTEIIHGRWACPTSAEFKSQELFIWYDYFCCPQDASGPAAHSRQRAIYSIPSYIAKCELFVILCPALRHDDGSMLSQATWAERGWCRAERLAHALAVRKHASMLVVESAMHQTLVGEAHGMLNAPGDGKFTDESDRTSLGPVIVQMVWNKLVYFLEQGDWHSYRCMLNEQRVRYLKSLDVDPIDGLIPKPPTSIDPFSSPQTFVLARFLHQNGFQSPLERDARGWSPLCFAAMNGDVMLVEALLDSKADVNDAITKAKKEMSLPKRMSVLSLAAFYHSSEVMRLLLARRAKLSATDAHQGTALHWASCSDNAEGVRILCAAGADPSKQCLPGLNPFNLACACSTANAMKELFAQVPSLDLRHSLHFAMMFFGGYSETVSFLIEVKADVNERFQVRLQEPVWWLIMNMAGIRHRLSPSRLTSLAYHHAGATPLMFSILSGYFEATSLLLASGARLDTQNSRKKTAADFAREMRAPEPLLRSLQGASLGGEERCDINVGEDAISI